MMTSCGTETETVSQMEGLTVDTLSTFCDGFKVQCVKLMLSKFLHLCFLLFDCFVCRHNVTCLKRFSRYGHYTCGGRHNHSETCNCLLN